MLLLHIYLFECFIPLVNCDYQFIFINLFVPEQLNFTHNLSDCYAAWYGPH
jgi:hypothetical protein